MMVKAFSRNIADYTTTPVYKDKINLKVWRAFLLRPTFVPRAEKLIKSSLSKKMLFYQLSLNVCNSEFNHITTGYSLFTNQYLDLKYCKTYKWKDSLDYEMLENWLSFRQSNLYWSFSLCFDKIWRNLVYNNKIKLGSFFDLPADLWGIA